MKEVPTSARCLVLIALLAIPPAAAQDFVVSGSSPVNSAVEVVLESTVEFAFTDSVAALDGDLPIEAFISPRDSLSIHSASVRDSTVSVAVTHQDDTDYTWIVSGARTPDGRFLDQPFVLRYTTSPVWGERTVSGEVHVVWLTGGGETSFRPLVALLTEPMTQTGEGIYTGFDAMAAADTVTGLDIQYEIDNYEINNVRDGTYWPVAFIDFDQNGVITDRDVFASYNNQSDSIVVDGEDVEDVDFHLTGGSSESVQPAGLQLHHPRPHPASGSAVIPFELEKGSEVSLRIYDMLGREVRTLLDGVFLPTGRHEVSWAAGIHPNGAYVCRLTAGQAQVSLTIIVAR